ncbi:alpha/beta fold hydrolase [Marinovum sp. 2_MG-2023]|uniref:alpha/beta hydrolase n=1 Tax=unclassified Marinovum TaxID=2647166 RepID=UPI0026E19F65|nr:MULTISPECIES: alpha/beta fold hydrolase [unclassified Marinovum]MDO6730157.1 alpha/beta fold hydrolase [Marinovum sp. 2_MG-2023]MDO6778895.1 alpha/beta fold hydrolase [Marinovum sp. 1_MG-2023]
MEDLTEAYENGAYIPGADKYRSRWPEDAAAFRACHDVQELPGFCAGSRRAVDMVRPDGAAQGTVIFVHGGYWRAMSRGDWTHLAAGALAQGWAMALPGYDLCPNVRISDITHQVAEAVQAIAAATSEPIVLVGHSAGGHLVARMLAPGMLPTSLHQRLQRVVPISMLSDLRPLMQTAMNADLALDPIEAAAESPVLQPKPDCALRLWVGGDERPAFLDQTRWLAEAWKAPMRIAEGRHHFDVIDALQDPKSDMIKDLLG